MPPLALAPNMPAGVPDILSYGYGDITNTIFNPAYNDRISAAEAAAADAAERARENAERDSRSRRMDSKTNRYNAETNRYNAKTDRRYKEALVQQAKDELAFKYHQQAQTYEIQRGTLGLNTLELGSRLRGPRDWDQYLETASRAGQDPILKGAMDTWASLSNVRPNTGAVPGPLPQRFDLNALASDFMGQGVTQQASGGVYDPMQNRNAALDTVAMGGAPAPGWWQGLSDDERERAKGYWETRGWSPTSVLNSLSYQSVNQGLGYGGS